MEVKILKEGDLDRLLLLYEHLHSDNMLASRQSLQLVWQQICRQEDTFIYFGLQDKEELVSSCCLTIVPNLTRRGRSLALIENVVTHAAYRNQGLGKRIMEHALNYAREMQCYKVMLLSNAGRKAAHRLYESLGFDTSDKIGYTIKL
jgi:GNAT superfamily N-acetyltransferase